jgi:hypothetical protein
MAEVQPTADQPTADPFSLQSRIERSEQRVARQRQIVEDLLKYNIAGPAQRVLDLMEQALAELREEYDREHQRRQQQAPAPVSEPAAEAAPPQPELATAE